jgi:hypothetical protein
MHSFGIGFGPAASSCEYGNQLQAVYETWNFLSGRGTIIFSSINVFQLATSVSFLICKCAPTLIRYNAFQLACKGTT